MDPLKAVEEMAKKAGYKKVTGSQHGVYMHPDTGHKLYLFNFTDGIENFMRWYDNGRLPSPPRVVANMSDRWWQIDLLEGENGRYIKFHKLTQTLTADEAVNLCNRLIGMIEG